MRTSVLYRAAAVRDMCCMLLCITTILHAGDRQLWPIVMVEKWLAPQWAVTVNEELRFDHDGKDFYFSRFDAGMLYRGAAWCDLAISYKQIDKKNEEQWQVSHVPMLDAWFYRKSRLVQATWQMKGEYQMPVGAEAYVVNRHKITLAAGRQYTALHIQPFAATELFYNVQKEEIFNRRFFVGFYLQPFAVPLRLAPQYLLMQTRSCATWLTQHIMVMNIKIIL